MAQKSLKDLFTDKDYNVPFVEKPAKAENIVNSELNPNRPLLQFGKNLPKVYGTDLIRIESRGSIDPARTMAVASARPAKAKGNGGGFGRFLSNLLGQNGAYRPSDTIFPADGVSPPVSKDGQPINQDWSGLKNAVESDTDYVDIARQALFFKQPGANPLTGLLKGNNPKEMAQEAAGRALGEAQKLITKGITGALTHKRKNKRNEGNNSLEEDIKKLTFDNKHTGGDYFKTNDASGEEILQSFKKAKIKSWDSLNHRALSSITKIDREIQDLVEKNTQNIFQYFLIKTSRNNNLLFPAAIESISETANPEWTDFRYVGSPFKVYRYVGVEREISIDFKVYYLGDNIDTLGNGVMFSEQSWIMKQKLNELRKLVFPDENVVTVDLKNANYSPLVFRPTIVNFSLGHYYQNIKAIVTSLDISVPKEVSWAHSNPKYDGTIQKPIVYPTCVEVSIKFKPLENATIRTVGDGKKLTYKLDDMSEKNGDENIPSTDPVKTYNKTIMVPDAPKTIPVDLKAPASMEAKGDPYAMMGDLH